MNYQHFDFVVENMSDAAAATLMSTIQALVDALGLTMGGGVLPETDADYPEEEADHETP